MNHLDPFIDPFTRPDVSSAKVLVIEIQSDVDQDDLESSLTLKEILGKILMLIKLPLWDVF